MPRMGEAARLREQRFLGTTIGLPDIPYVPSEPGDLRGFKLVFYDLSDVKLGEIGSDSKVGAISNVNFELMSLGCGAFDFTLDDEPSFTISYRTRVDIHPYFDTTPWFTGFIQTLPKTGKRRPYKYTGFGFFEQLDWVTVTDDYSSVDIADIVKDIIQYKVAPYTQIIYNASKIETTSYVIDDLDFYLVSAKDAIQSLADLAAGYEFGVDDSREFYFRAIDSTVYHALWEGKHFRELDIEENPHTVRNRLYIKVGLIQGPGYGYIKEGSNCIGYEDDATSISTYGLRETVVTAPETLNVTDAREWAKELLSKTKNPEISAEIQDLMFDQTRAKIVTLGKARITAHDGSTYTLYIKRVKYTIKKDGIKGDIELE